MNALKSRSQGTTELNKVTFSSQGAIPISISDAKDWMRIEGSVDDIIVEGCIEDVVDEFMRLTNKSLISQTITALYTSYGREISLPYAPVESITSVNILDEGEKEALAVDDYYLHGNTLHLKNLQSTGLEVVYQSNGDLPKGLRRALYQSILTTYNDREDNVMGSVITIPSNSRKKALRYKRY